MPVDCVNGVPVMFIHIPKTGGSSIKKYFQMQVACHRTAQDFLYHMNKGIVPVTLNEEEGSSLAKATLWKENMEKILEEAEKKQEHLFSKSFKFSFVRNPWDRFSSIYHYHKNDFGGLDPFEHFINDLKNLRGPIFSSESQTILKLTQTEYLSVGEEFKELYNNNIEGDLSGANYNAHSHFASVRYASGNNALNAMNYIGRTETAQKDVKNICHILDNEYKSNPSACTDRYWMNNRGEFTQHEKKSANNESRYTKMYTEFDFIYTVFDYYYDDVVNFSYTFSGTSNCEITKECFRIKARKDAS